MRGSGTYKIENLVNGNFYVGSAVNFSKRKNRHFKHLRLNNHENAHLQNAFNKYGNQSFKFIRLKDVPIENLLEEEQKLLDEHFGKPYCYNICPTAGSPFLKGRKKTEEHKRKLSKATKSYFKLHPDARRHLSLLRKGKPLSNEIKQKMREGHKRGEIHHNARLTEAKVLKIRSKYVPFKYGFGSLADEFGVDRKTIVRILQRKTWTHI